MKLSEHVDGGYHSLDEVHGSIDTTKHVRGWRRLFAFLGPAYLVSVGYMDPGNWATDIAGGSHFLYALIWVLLLSNLMAILLQYLSARLGVVRGLDLAQASRETYPKSVNYVLYILAEIAITATDLAEVLGMAIGLKLLFGLPLLIGVSITFTDTFLLLLFQKYGMRKMEAFIVALISIMGISFLINLFMAGPDLSKVVTGFVPTLPGSYALYVAIGIIGATVMPHNLYLHSALVQTRKYDRSEKGKWAAIKFNLIDSAIALNLAFFVNAAILVLAGAAFFTTGHYEVVGIQQAHHLLAPLLGSTIAPILFAVALIASGQSSTITGTLAGQIVMEGYLHLRIQPWLRRIITRMMAIIPAFLTIMYMGQNATDQLLILSQVILSLQLGFAVVPLIHFVSDKEKMGSFAINIWIKIASWVTAYLIIALNVKLVYDTLSEWMSTTYQPLIQYPVVILSFALGFLLLFITVKPWLKKEAVLEATTPHLDYSTEISKLIEQKEVRRVAVTVDFSNSDLKAISTAVNQCKENGEFILIHIVESAGARIMGGDISDLESQSDRRKMEEYAETLKEKGFKVNYLLGYGSPKKAIPLIIKETNVDLVVMGTHGHRGIKDLIFGQTVDYVRHHISVPLLIV